MPPSACRSVGSPSSKSHAKTRSLDLRATQKLSQPPPPPPPPPPPLKKSSNVKARNLPRPPKPPPLKQATSASCSPVVSPATLTPATPTPPSAPISTVTQLSPTSSMQQVGLTSNSSSPKAETGAEEKNRALEIRAEAEKERTTKKRAWLRTLIEFYLLDSMQKGLRSRFVMKGDPSTDNLWYSVQSIARLRKCASITTDLAFVVSALEESAVLELDDDKAFVREKRDMTYLDRTVFAVGLPLTVDVEIIRSAVSILGAVENIAIHPPPNIRTTTIAEILFYKAADVATALRVGSIHYKGSKVFISRKNPHAKDPTLPQQHKELTLYTAGWPLGTTILETEKYFSQFAEIASVRSFHIAQGENKKGLVMFIELFSEEDLIRVGSLQHVYKTTPLTVRSRNPKVIEYGAPPKDPRSIRPPKKKAPKRELEVDEEERHILNTVVHFSEVDPLSAPSDRLIEIFGGSDEIEDLDYQKDATSGHVTLKKPCADAVVKRVKENKVKIGVDLLSVRTLDPEEEMAYYDFKCRASATDGRGTWYSKRQKMKQKTNRRRIAERVVKDNKAMEDLMNCMAVDPSSPDANASVSTATSQLSSTTSTPVTGGGFSHGESQKDDTSGNDVDSLFNELQMDLQDVNMDLTTQDLIMAAPHAGSSESEPNVRGRVKTVYELSPVVESTTPSSVSLPTRSAVPNLQPPTARPYPTKPGARRASATTATSPLAPMSKHLEALGASVTPAPVPPRSAEAPVAVKSARRDSDVDELLEGLAMDLDTLPSCNDSAIVDHGGTGDDSVPLPAGQSTATFEPKLSNRGPELAESENVADDGWDEEWEED